MDKYKKTKLPIIFAILYGITLIISGITGFLTSKWDVLWLSLIALACIPIPFIIAFIANIKKIYLPNNFIIATLLFNFSAQFLGEIIDFYNFWWWDLLLHGIFGSYAVIIGLHIIRGIIKNESEITERRFLIFKLIFSFSFAITLGTLWEMLEFICDFFFKTQMVTGGLNDTATDLLIKIAFALITSILYYHHKNKEITS